MKQPLTKFFFLLLAAGLTTSLSAQNNDGGIDADLLSVIKQAYTGSAEQKAIRNALNAQSMSLLAENSENIAMIDTHFSDEVKTKGITDQKSSGRCWLFSGLNVLRAKMISTHDLGDFAFSQNYVFFYDQLEKANLFLESIIRTRSLPMSDRTVDWLFSNPLGDGGQFTGISDLVTKYGLVPASVMPETLCANSTSNMSTQLRTLMRQDGLALRAAGKKADLSAMKTDMLKDVYRILCLCLGEPPTEFEWTRYNSKNEFVSCKTYTPKSFYDEFVGADLQNNYVMLMNDPSREYGKVYEIEYDRHVYDGHNWLYINLPVERIKEVAIASIKDDTAMYFSCDVAKCLNRSKGVADLDNYDYESLLGVQFTMDKKERILTHASGSSHAMTLKAVDINAEGKPVKWMVENSWGASSGYKGNIIMTDRWFDEYMFRVVAEKKYVPADILKMLEQEPIKLPAWDPMFLPEE